MILLNMFKKKYNCLWVILFCNNLATHISNVIKAIFVASKVFLYYFLSNTLESVQPIDTRYSRSMQYKIEEILDT